MSFKLTFPKFIFVVIFFLILNIITISLGDSESSLTVVNKTEHYLHIYIDGENYLYVSPERSATHAMKAKPSVEVVVLYSPGQGITGSVTKTIDVPYTDASSSCSCDEETGHSSCSYDPPSGGSKRWEVYPEDLQ